MAKKEGDSNESSCMHKTWVVHFCDKVRHQPLPLKLESLFFPHSFSQIHDISSCLLPNVDNHPKIGHPKLKETHMLYEHKTQPGRDSERRSCGSQESSQKYLFTPSSIFRLRISCSYERFWVSSSLGRLRDSHPFPILNINLKFGHRVSKYCPRSVQLDEFGQLNPLFYAGFAPSFPYLSKLG